MRNSYSQKDTEKFVTSWQKSENVEQVATDIGGTLKDITKRASFLRGKGVPLKKMSTGIPPLDYVRLMEVAKDNIE